MSIVRDLEKIHHIITALHCIWLTSNIGLCNIHFIWHGSDMLNTLAPGRFKVNFKWVIFKLILVVNGWGISCGTALIWVSLDHTYDKSTLVQVMAWCRQATSTWANADPDLCHHMASLGHNELKYSSNFDCSTDSNTVPHQASRRVSVVNLPLCSDTTDVHQQAFFIMNFMMEVDDLYPQITQAICVHRVHSMMVIVPQESYQGTLT